MINDIMTADVTHMNFSTKNISFTRMQTGWLFPADRTEKVSRFVADFYDVHGLQFVTKKRREHLSEEDIVRNKKALQGKIGKTSGPPVFVEESTRTKLTSPGTECRVSVEHRVVSLK